MGTKLYRYGSEIPQTEIANAMPMSDIYSGMSDQVVINDYINNPCICRWVHITDTHHMGVWDQRTAQIYAAVIDVSKRSNADFICHTGDVITGLSGTKSTGWKQCLQGISNMAYESPVPFIVSRGNHDDNSIGSNVGDADAVVSNSWWNNKLEYINSNFVIPASSNGYFYMDIPGKRIRVVQINASDLTDAERLNPGGQNFMKISDEQLAWLDSVALDVDSGWKIICVCHANAYNYNPNSGITNRADLYSLLSSHSQNISAYVFGHQHVRSYYYDSVTGIVFVGGENSGGTRTTFSSATYHTEYASAEARANAPTEGIVFDVCSLMHDGTVARVRWGVEPDVIAT